MNSILDALLVIVRGIAGLVGGFLPRRRWDTFSMLPIEPLAVFSGLVTGSTTSSSPRAARRIGRRARR
jgi:hypothetical protein